MLVLAVLVACAGGERAPEPVAPAPPPPAAVADPPPAAPPAPPPDDPAANAVLDAFLDAWRAGGEVVRPPFAPGSASCTAHAALDAATVGTVAYLGAPDSEDDPEVLAARELLHAGAGRVALVAFLERHQARFHARAAQARAEGPICDRPGCGEQGGTYVHPVDRLLGAVHAPLDTPAALTRAVVDAGQVLRTLGDGNPGVVAAAREALARSLAPLAADPEACRAALAVPAPRAPPPTARLRLRATDRGSVPPELEEVVKRSEAAFASCNALGFVGRMVIRFRTQEGEVIAPVVREDEIDYAPLEACVLARISGWRIVDPLEHELELWIDLR